MNPEEENDGRYERFDLSEHKPPPNYRSILNLRNREVAERQRNAPKEVIPDIIAVCGMNCAECEYYTGALGDGEKDGCPGCSCGGNDCDIRICCLVKSCKSCYNCGEFPCDKLRASDAEFGGSDLVRLKSDMDRQKDLRDRKRNRMICGALTGFLLGLLLDMALNSTAVWLLAGTAVGIAIPAIIGVSAKP